MSVPPNPATRRTRILCWSCGRSWPLEKSHPRGEPFTYLCDRCEEDERERLSDRYDDAGPGA